MKSLESLLRGLIEPSPWQAHGALEITGIYDDSRQVQPGGLFVALRGTSADGAAFARDAVRRGARVVIGEALAPIDGAMVLSVPDARATLAKLAARWYGLEFTGERGMQLVGVTGTNGKSTTAYMTQAILRAAGLRCGMLGTVQYDLCTHTITATMTTPGPLELAFYLRQCADAGGRAAVMEVSSHALDQRRTEGLRFAAAGFTNLTRDHLDYHRNFESYREAKARLFHGLDENAVAVVNRDDPNYVHMIEGCRARVVTFSLDGEADISARITRNTIQGTVFRMRIGGRDLVLENAMVGRHNVYNAITAAGLAAAVGAGPEAIEAGLSSVRNIPGRLQRVSCIQGVEVFVDYAHTDDALRNVLSVLRPLTKRRLLVVFGCGGDRDRGKRPRMAQAVAEFAHAVVVTSDNPRTENPQSIIDEILTGFDAEVRRRVIVEPDRRAAVRIAMASAGEGDVVLIAGKGHESYQIVGSQRLHFDDVEAAIQAASELSRSRVGVP